MYSIYIDLFEILDFRGTAILAFNNLINETENIASEHEVMTDQLTERVLKPLNGLLIELKNNRRLVLSQRYFLAQHGDVNIN